MTQINLHPLERAFVEQVMDGRVGRRDLAAAAGVARTTETGRRLLSVRTAEPAEPRD